MKKKETNAKKSAEWILERASPKSDFAAFQWLKGVGWYISPFLVSDGVVYKVAQQVALYSKKNISLKKGKMPEDWYAKVVVDSSEKGRFFLYKIMNRQGFISVSQALNWLKIESIEANINSK